MKVNNIINFTDWRQPLISYVLYRVGVYLIAAIGKVFGVGNTAILGAVKRGQDYLEAEGELE